MLDIVEYAERIGKHLDGRELRGLKSDTLSYDAVERCIAIITEAVIRLDPERLHAIAPDVPFTPSAISGTCSATPISASTLP